MIKNPVKKSLQEMKPSIGSWLSLAHVPSARLMSRVGFEWLVVDLEHSAIDWETAGDMFAAIADAGCVPIARVPRGNHDHIKRVLDAGAHGIIVPMVNTVEEAKACIAAAKFPPEGNRSVGSPMAAINFGMPAKEYYKRANDEILVILQTESPEAVENAKEIYSLPGLDCAFIGPFDLRTQMRDEQGNDPCDEVFEATIQKVLDAGKAANLPVGIYNASIEMAQKRLDQGFQFIGVSSELSMMVKEAERTAEILGLKSESVSGLY